MKLEEEEERRRERDDELPLRLEERGRERRDLQVINFLKVINIIPFPFATDGAVVPSNRSSSPSVSKTHVIPTLFLALA